MSVRKVLYSKQFFIINLILLGLIVGFVSASFIFSGKQRNASITEKNGNEVQVVSNTRYNAGAENAAINLQDAFNQVAQSVVPSIVELRVTAKAQNTLSSIPLPFFGGNPEQAPEEQVEGLGSGIIIRQTGKKVYVLTNNHVVDGATKIIVKLYDDTEIEGKITGVDNRRDLAVVSFETDNTATVAVLGNSDNIKVGDWAIAIGSPLGLSQSVTVGVVSAINRNGGPDDNINDFIQTDTAINRGNSGGALVNIKGEVIGINTWIASPNGGNVGLGFSIPINNTKRVIDSLIEKGIVKYGWLGVTVSDADSETIKAMNLENIKGAFVSNVFIGSPAQKAGLLPGDIITQIEGKTVTAADQVIRIVGEMLAGKRYSFTVIRQKKQLTLTALITERKELSQDDYGNLWPGISVVSINERIQQVLGLSSSQNGIVVASVQKGSPAETLQLKEGDVIIRVNDKSVKTIAEFYSAINEPSSKKIQFTILRDKQELTTMSYVRKF